MAVSPISLMPQPDKPKPGGSKPSKVPFLMRTQAMGSSGWEGYTVGFTLVGCIVAGAGAGYLLDSHFKTSYWLPVLFLVGVVGGFREMLAVLKRISAQQDQQRREKMAATTLAPTPARVEDPTELPAERKRVFQVPPPPFEETPGASQSARSEDADDILKRLLDEGDDDLQTKDGQKPR